MISVANQLFFLTPVFTSSPPGCPATSGSGCPRSFPTGGPALRGSAGPGHGKGLQGTPPTGQGWVSCPFGFLFHPGSAPRAGWGGGRAAMAAGGAPRRTTTPRAPRGSPQRGVRRHTHTHTHTERQWGGAERNAHAPPSGAGGGEGLRRGVPAGRYSRSVRAQPAVRSGGERSGAGRGGRCAAGVSVVVNGRAGAGRR